MPNEKVLAEYRKANIEYRETTEDLVERDWLLKTEGRPIKKRINSVYRKKVTGKQEYLLYNETLIGFNDNSTQQYHFSRLIGAYDLPSFETRYSQEARKYVPYAVSGQVKNYSIPFSKANLQKILTGQKTGAPGEYEATGGIDEYNTAFLVDAGYARFGGFTADELANRNWDDLVAKGTTGRYPEPEKKLVISTTSSGGTTAVEEEPATTATTRRLRQVKRGLVEEEGEGEPTTTAATTTTTATATAKGEEEYTRMGAERADMLEAIPAAEEEEEEEEEEEYEKPRPAAVTSPTKKSTTAAASSASPSSKKKKGGK